MLIYWPSFINSGIHIFIILLIFNTHYFQIQITNKIQSHSLAKVISKGVEFLNCYKFTRDYFDWASEVQPIHFDFELLAFVNFEFIQELYHLIFMDIINLNQAFNPTFKHLMVIAWMRGD
jgi:hypothetical protein